MWRYPVMSDHETPDKQVVLVFTHKQAAALAVAATAGIMYIGLDAKEKDGEGVGAALRDVAGLFADVAECVGAINDAMGNPTSESYGATIRQIREMGNG
jgi:hypothetical protein